MHVHYQQDPRVYQTGYWSVPGMIKSCTEGEIALLTNFLSSFLTDSRYADGDRLLKNAFRIGDEADRVYISFQHAQNLLNFFDTMGWTYHIRGEKID